MSEPFLGEILMFAGNFSPAQFSFCNGGLLPIANNDALFSLLGTTYGGDGQQVFGLPDLRGRLPVSQGSGPQLTQRVIGDRYGVENVTLVNAELPAHTHAFLATQDAPVEAKPGGQVLATQAEGNNLYAPGGTSQNAMSAAATGLVGGGLPHSNLMPFLCINFIISLAGVFPSQN